VAPLRPHWGWRVAVVGSFAFFVLLTALVAAGGLLIVGGGVVVFVLGLSVIGPLVAEASRPPVCPACGREAVPWRASRRRSEAQGTTAPAKGARAHHHAG
jgi:hypothetical protein